ncbi:MAG: PAS domain-containing protein, partial [Vicinamibacterales bacterium]
SHLDLISCRNLLIYLNRAIQDRVVETFHFALRPGGYLFLGSSESPEGAGDLFLRLDVNAHIYESRTITSRLALPVTDSPPVIRPEVVRPPATRSHERIAPASLHQRLLEQYAPPSLIINEDYLVVHMSDHVGRFLRVPPGEPSRDLLAMVRTELRPDLRTALHQAAAQRQQVDVREVAVAFEDGERVVDLSVRPVMREGDPPAGFFLILFNERDGSAHATAPVTLTSPAEPPSRQLEEELSSIKAQLRATIEQYETHVEEAKASNEELQAMNEELRSAAEELETSKEELQSVNEELTTVNQELKIKIEELSLTNNDFQNFIAATDTGSIFLDRQLRVKFSTPLAREVFNLMDADIGRPLSDITSRLKYDRIHQDVQTVLDRLTPIEHEVETENGHWHLMRLLPYRTLDDRIDGVVLTFQDITSRRNTELRVRQSEERLRLLIEGATDYAIFTVTEDGRIDYWSQGAERLFGYRADKIIGERVDVLFTQDDREAGAPQQELERARTTGRSADERLHVRQDGTRFYCSGLTVRLGRGGLGFAKIARDLTQQRESAEALRQAHVALEDRVRQRTAELEAAVRDQQAARAQVRELLRRIVTAQEVERTRIARDLHDSVGQQLTALRLVLEREAINGSAQSSERILDIARELEQEVDYLAWELHPRVLDELGLAAALPRFVSEWSSHIGISAEVRIDHFEPGQLARETEVAFYRITQEALNNVAKHAHASRVDVVLSASHGTVSLVIEDDGVGFNVDGAQDDTNAVGVLSMRERAAFIGADLQIESAPGRGTTVYCRCPVVHAS